jgi:pyridinium-3,5-bisthiocarboxylic acid mononucleotide nickel chelatase
MRAAFFDLIGGASGNMLFGAFVDAGVDFDQIVKILKTIPVDGWSIVRERTQRRGVEATYIDVVVPGEDDHTGPPGRRTFAEIIAIFESSELSRAQVARATTIAERLRGPDLRFHPIGQIDAIIDIAATCIAAELLDIERFFCSAFPRGSVLPGKDMVTATGAAILSTLVEQPGFRPELRVERSGYGAGRSDFPMPNVTRVEVGELV